MKFFLIRHALKIAIVAACIGAALYFSGIGKKKERKATYSTLFHSTSGNKKKKNRNEEERKFAAALSDNVKKDDAPAWVVEQIRGDFAPFMQSGITEGMLDAVIAKGEALKADGFDPLFVRYRIQDNRVALVQCSPGFENEYRLLSMTKALNTLCHYTAVPDVDFIVTLHDALDGIDFPGPVCAFAKNLSSDKIVLIPDFEALTSSFYQLKKVEEGKKLYPWDDKLPLAFWRGSLTGGTFTADNFLQFPRSSLVAVSLNFPQLIDARYINIVQCSEPRQVKRQFPAYFGTHATVLEHLKFKYQILVDGNTCAYSRAYWQLFSDCVTFKHASPNIQWFYRALQPGVHYIPLNAMLDDLPEKVRWAIEHDAEVQAISCNAQKFAEENLKLSDIYYYLYMALAEMARLESIPRGL